LSRVNEVRHRCLVGLNIHGLKAMAVPYVTAEEKFGSPLTNGGTSANSSKSSKSAQTGPALPGALYLSRKVPKRMLRDSSLVNTTSRGRIKQSQKSEADFFGAGERWGAIVGGALLFSKFDQYLAGGHFRVD
jgi:hypothetical protein